MKKRGSGSLMRKRNLTGYVFCIPWVLGFLLFFLTPIVQTALYSFRSFDKVTLEGTFVGLRNFQTAFAGDAEFPQRLVGSLKNMIDVPLILVFAYFVALLLRKPFKGSAAVKTVFFLTVILASDLFMRLESSVSAVNNAQMSTSVNETHELFGALQAIDLTRYFEGMGKQMTELMEYINSAIEGIFDIMIRSGVQIFIFLAALHAIPTSFYEAAQMEGCTAWEGFWTITFPMTSPMILVNAIYTIVDSFGSYLNPTITYINGVSFTKFEYGYASALSWIYFLCIAVIVTVIFLLFRRRLFYQN